MYNSAQCLPHNLMDYFALFCARYSGTTLFEPNCKIQRPWGIFQEFMVCAKIPPIYGIDISAKQISRY